MKTIYKYIIPVTDSSIIQMPRDSKILSVQLQGDDLCLWALVDPDLPLRDFEINIIGTGNPAGYVSFEDFIGTVQPGPFVWHIFGRWV